MEELRTFKAGSAWRRCWKQVAAAGLLLTATGGAAQAASFTPGNLVVVRVGTGAAFGTPVSPVTTLGAAVFLDEFTPTGRLVQSLPLPTAVSGADKAFALAATTGFSTEGAATLSTDNRYLVLGGYDAAPGAALASFANNGTGPSFVQPLRVVARIGADGVTNTATSFANNLTNSYTPNTGIPTATTLQGIRATASDDGSRFWVVGSTVATGGTGYIALGGSSATQLSTNVTNNRGINIANGQLYSSSASGLFTGVDAVGTGLPTTASQTTANLFGNASGDSGSNGPSPYGFQFFDLDSGIPGVDVCYVADARTTGTGGGIQKWSKVGATTWVLNGILASAAGLQTITGQQVSGGAVQLFSTAQSAVSTAGLYTVTDNTGYNVAPTGTLVRLVAPAANTAYRGVAFSPQVPNPPITVAQLSGNTFCATTAQAITVTYSLNQTFGAGNTFTAQLSDASGSFATPTVLGSVSGTTATPISGSIAAGTPSGTGYRVRVVSSNPAATGIESNPITIVSNPTVTLSPSGPQGLVASNNGTTLTGTENPAVSIPATTRQFFVSTNPGGPFTTALGPANAASYTPNFATPGTYYVVLTSTFAGCGAATSAPVQITVGPNTSTATIGVSQAGTGIGNGGSFNFLAVTTGSAGTPVAFTVANTSATDPLNISGIVFSNSQFALSGAAPTTVNPSTSATLNVVFTPSAQGARTGSVTINSNDVANGAYLVNFTGTGNAPAPTLGSILPASIVAGIPTTVTFTGTNFVSGATVSFNGSTLPTTFVSSTAIRAVVSPTLATSGTFPVTVTVPPPGGGTTTTPVVNLTVTANPGGFFEPFEQTLYTTYAPGNLAFTTGNWYFSNALTSNNDANDRKNNAQSARIRTEGNAPSQQGYIATNFDKPNGVNAVSFQAAVYGVESTTTGGIPNITAAAVAANLAASQLTLEVSNDGGSTWTAATRTIGPLTATLASYSVTGLNVAGNVRLRLRNTSTITSGSTSALVRLNVDDVQLTDYTATTAAATDLTVAGPQTLGAPTYRNVTINSGGTLALNGKLTVTGTLTLNNGGALTLNADVPSVPAYTNAPALSQGGLGGSGSLSAAAGSTVNVLTTVATAQITNTGGRNLSAATFNYSGTAAQTGQDLPATVAGIAVNNAANGLTLTQPVAVTQLVNLQSGDLDTGGFGFVLRSVAGAGTALIDNTGGGVTGTGTMQRATDNNAPGAVGYHQYSAPVSNTTVADLDVPGTFTNSFNTAYNGATSPSSTVPFPTVFGYDQARLVTSPAVGGDAFSKGWFVPLAGGGSPMEIGKGYTANIPNAAVVDFVGTFNNGSLSVTGLSRGLGSEAGWQLVGNPYPSPLNWDNVAASRRTGLDGAMYVFNSTGRYAGTYRTRQGGVGDSPLIVAGSGFFVRTLPGQTGAINFENNDRVKTFGTQPAFGRGTADARPLLALTLANAANTLADDAYVYVQAGATAGVDAGFDASKLTNPSGLNLAALAGTERLAINGLPLLAGPTLVPLTVAVPAAGSYVLTAGQLANFGGTTVVLRDALAGTRTVLVQGTAYRFAVAGTLANGRFVLELNPAAAPLASAAQALAAQVQVYPNPAHGRFTLTLPAGAGPAQATLLNALGQAVVTRTIALTVAGATSEFNTTALPTGIYALTLKLGHDTVTRRVVVE